ncbi:MAG: hypothetical protein ACRECZ_04605 [Methylocella sp.]
MPWKECSGMDERLRFVARLLGGLAMSYKSLDLIYRSLSGFVIHLTAGIIGEADSILSRTRA